MAVPIKGHKQGAQGAEPELPSRRLAAIMFTDLVGYSAMAQRDEALAIDLLEQHRTWVRAILPRFGGREIETVGDAFLIEFGSALSAVECALAVQDRFAGYNEHAPYTRRMQLRIGIHLGDVEHRGDKVMGDGVNLASRIHGMAEPGGICVSEDIQRAVRNRGGLVFTSMGKPKLKNIDAPVELFEVHAAGSGGMGAAIVAGVKRRVGKIPRWLMITVAVIVLINIFDKDDDEKGPGPGDIVVNLGDEQPSIAVLPFENLSSEADNAFFTDGLHDTVIGHLSRVSGLKVISRTSVLPYRGKQKNLKRIGRELGADHVLEGSVQRSGSRVRVAAQLIETDTDTHVWSHEYDGELKDVFAVQADIAQSVAAAVHAKLTPQEQASIESVPTHNQAAYDLYLRAVLVERSAQNEPKKILEAIGWLDEAIRLDPKFARAYALRAFMHDTLHWFGFDPTDERRAKVAADVEMALQLEPGSAEAHVAKAMHLYHGSRAYDAALKELEVARGIAPGSGRVHYWLAPIYRRQGRWEEALVSLERAVGLDPLNASIFAEYAGTLQMLRRYTESEQAFERLKGLDPDSPFVNVTIGFARFLRDGDLAAFSKVVDAIPASVDPECQSSLLRSKVALIGRRFNDAIAAMKPCKQARISAGSAEQVPAAYFTAVARWLLAGRMPPREAPAVRDELEKMLAERPDQPGARMSLAFTYVMLGDRWRALQEAERAIEQMPLSRDALTGANILRAAIDIHANAGAEERALDEIEKSLKLPNGLHAQELRFDPVFDPLRENPRFKKLLAEHLPKAG